jgi:hypothetical protein
MLGLDQQQKISALPFRKAESVVPLPGRRSRHQAPARHVAFRPRVEKIFLFGFAVTHGKVPIRPKESKEIQAFFLGFIWFFLDYLADLAHITGVPK